MEVDEPEDATYLERCDRFTQITQTNNAIAMMYLQDRGWDLQLSLTDYFKDNERPDQPPTVEVVDLTDDNSISEQQQLSMEPCEDQPRFLNLLSWNLDGLDERNLRDRTITVVSLIENEKPHIVCFQEVTQTTLDVFRAILTNYHVFSAVDVPFADCIHYFVTILIRRTSQLHVHSSSLQIYSFPESKMGRQLLSVDISLRHKDWLGDSRHQPVTNQNLRLRIYTSHLESCREGSEERKSQLKHVWDKMLRIGSASSTTPESTLPHACIFCGDLNLRDSEVDELGGLPTGIIDVWEATGCRPELRSTWDPVRNINAARFFKGRYRPQPNRYDRIYWSGRWLEAVDFGLRGLEKVPSHSCFPSDHWGVLSRFLIR